MALQASDQLKFLARAMELAENGRGFVSPNPVVGAVLVREGKIIAEDWHRQFGEGHAERNLLDSFDGKIQKKDVLYITLEPCCHQGKTPACTKIILEKGVQHVVVGLLDPNPEVSGKGVEQLREEGVEVLVFEEEVKVQGPRSKQSRHSEPDEGISTEKLLDQLKWQNRFFFKWIEKKQPWVTLKMAQTFDGRVVPERGKQYWLTGEESRRHVHRQRAQFDAILVGLGTVLADDPRLTVRDLQDQDLPHQPTVVVLDAALGLPLEKAVIRPGTIIVTGTSFQRREKKRQALEEKGVEVIQVDADQKGMLDLHQIVEILAQRGVASLYVEGGAAVWSSFLREDLVDELMVYMAPQFLGDGVSSVEGLGFQEGGRLDVREHLVLENDLYVNATLSRA